jgi:nitrate/TMAO reductase-like tetraheme cytochrome c subunit
MVDSKVIDASNHGGMECKTCHGAGYVKFPHAQDARENISPCGECHARKVFKIEKEIEKSVHTKSEKGDRFTCNTCHNPHVYRVAAKIVKPRAIVLQDNAFCMDCHESELRYAEYAPQAKRLPKMETVHAWLPSPTLHWGAVRCVDCHTPAGKTLSHEIQKKDTAEKQCVSCHSRDSVLRTRLYRHLIEEERLSPVGFVNAGILTSTYIIGATRNEYLDFAAMGLVGLTVAALALHGLLRILGHALRRSRRTPHV